MGTFSIEIGIGDPDRGRWKTLDALVDTGAFVTAAPASVLRELGVQPSMRRSFESAHGEVREMDVGQTWVRVQGEEVITLILFNDEGTMPLLGALTLETLFMGVDPARQRLVSVHGLM
jgi:clan AA aspartic protease